MKWSQKTWLEAKTIYDKIEGHPFIKGLINGTLPKEIFLFYIQQDAIYLAEYGKILTGIASKLNDPKQIEAFTHFACDSLAVEKALHENYMKELKNSKSTSPTPSCLLYTSYLHSRLGNASIEETLAAVLPCFWVYKEVGDYILSQQTKGTNPYQSWIDTYGGEEFERSVHTAISICDEIAEQCTEKQQAKMTQSFIVCTQLEWMFWDSAYKLEQWPIHKK